MKNTKISLYDRVIACSMENAGKVQTIPLDSQDVMHFHSSIEIGTCIRGRGQSTVEGTTVNFEEGDYQIILPFQSHKHTPCENTEVLWKWFFINCSQLSRVSSNFDDILKRISLYGIIKKDFDPQLSGLFDALLAVVDSECSFRTEKLRSFFTLLLIRLSELSVSPPPKQNKLKNNEVILDILSYINKNLEESKQVSVGEISAFAKISESQCRRIFKAVLGISPKQYVLDCAIHKAMHLLHTTSSTVIDIAEATGFWDISTFNRAFLKHTGQTPTVFRTGETVD